MEYTIHIDLNGISYNLNKSIGKIIQLIGHGLSCSNDATKFESKIPNLSTELEPPIPIAIDLPTLQKEFSKWIITKGLCEIFESIHGSLEEVKNVCIIFSEITPGEIQKMEPFQKKRIKLLKKFHNMPLKEKIENLQTEYNLDIPPSIEFLYSIKKVRNCLVHRDGIVIEGKDTKTNEDMIAKWCYYNIYISNKGKKIPLKLPFKVREGDRLMVSIQENEKHFKPGDIISFTEEEFIQICFCLIIFTKQLIENIQKFGESRGYRFKKVN